MEEAVCTVKEIYYWDCPRCGTEYTETEIDSPGHCMVCDQYFRLKRLQDGTHKAVQPNI